MPHAYHAKPSIGSVEIRYDLDVYHHVAVFVVEDMAMDDELADVVVIMRAYVDK